MKVKTEDLRSAFQVLDAVTATPAFESSMFVRFASSGRKLTLNMTGTLWASKTLPGAAEGTWEWFVERRLLKAFIGTANAPNVDIELKDKFLLLKAGQLLKVPGRTAISGYGSWSPKTEFTLNDTYRAVLPALTKYCSPLAGMEYVNAVRFAPAYGVISTDTIFVAVLLDPKQKSDFMLPPSIADLAQTYSSAKICYDKNGVGLDIGGGFFYQPLSDELQRYPMDTIQSIINEVNETKPCATMVAAEVSNTLSAMKEFLLEKNTDKVAITPDTGRLILSILVGGSKIQRAIPLKSGALAGKNPSWVIEKILPWIKFIVQLDKDAVLEYLTLRDMSAFRYKSHLLVFVNA